MIVFDFNPLHPSFHLNELCIAPPLWLLWPPPLRSEAESSTASRLLPRGLCRVSAQFLDELAGHWVVRELFHGDAGGCQRVLEASRVRQRAHQVEVCVPGLRIVREDVAEEGDSVAVDACLTPGQGRRTRR